MRTTLVATVIAIIGIIGLSGIAVAGDSDSRITATLDGEPLEPVLVSFHYCHDLTYPVISCYGTARQLEEAMPQARSRLKAARDAAVDYVTMYSDPTYGGTYMHVSQDYDVLALIGWNDRVSSFKARNSQSGTFWSDWFESGQATDFCCNQTVPVLASGVNDTFSSVYRD